MEPKFRAFWVFYSDRPDTHGKEAWAAHGAKELVQALNETCPFEHTQYNVQELTDSELTDPALLDDEGTTVIGLLEEFDDPGQLFELYAAGEHPTGAPLR